MQEIRSGFSSSSERDIVREIKESCAYVAQNFQEELHNPKQTSYMLPDGHGRIVQSNNYFPVMSVSTERFRCTEPLFNPSSVGLKQAEGIHEMIVHSLDLIDIQLHQQLKRNTVLLGASTLLDGFETRLNRELSQISPQQYSIHAAEFRKYASWIGGTIMSSLSTFSEMFVTFHLLTYLQINDARRI